MTITSRLPRADYDAIDALSITRLKEMRRSPQHYQWALTHPKTSDALTLGIATHVAVLEPERFERDFATWERRTDAGAMAPRRGQYWEEFSLLNHKKTILTPDEGALAKQIAAAVRNHEIAMKYLQHGDPEVSMSWAGMHDTACKGRADWLTHIDGVPTLVGLKTARDCRHMIFGTQAAKLGYHLQWAFYHDGYAQIRDGAKPQMVEIVVESAPPHAIAVYRIPNDIIEQGREEYQNLIELLIVCQDGNQWPGPQPVEEDLTMPSWAYQRDEDDVGDLGLEFGA